jgi:hypothetical protein
MGNLAVKDRWFLSGWFLFHACAPAMIGARHPWIYDYAQIGAILGMAIVVFLLVREVLAE